MAGAGESSGGAPTRPNTTLAEVSERLPEAATLAAEGGPPVAVFDADGTLWPGDVQEDVLRAFIAGRRLLGVDYGRDVFFHEYQVLVERDPPAGLLRAMTLFAGLDAAEVDRAARVVVERDCVARAYAEMVYFVGCVRELGYEPWIVSGSAERFVRMAAPALGVDEACVIGLRTEVDADGRLTDRGAGEVPYGEGKVRCIDQIIGRRPWVAVGNGRADYEMLQAARAVAVCVNPDPELLARAEHHGWPVVEVKRPEDKPGGFWAA
ncbi:MAG TPA: HAD-IB family phosphatase [Myxococcota bacterium]|nr:HAD-IB family phosphatase [Myxococcota bacterium]